MEGRGGPVEEARLYYLDYAATSAVRSPSGGEAVSCFPLSRSVVVTTASDHNAVLLWEGLGGWPGARGLFPPREDGAGMVSMVSDRAQPPSLAERLEWEWGVMVRHCLSCGREVHRILGATQQGAIRLSVGWNSTSEDADWAIMGTEDVTAAPTVPVS